MSRFWYIILRFFGCVKVPIKVLESPPVNDTPPAGYTLARAHEFRSPADVPPNADLDTCEVWGVNHVCRKDGGMYDKSGQPVAADDPANFCEWRPAQVKLKGSKLELLTDLNPVTGQTPVVAGLIATLATYEAPVYIAARVKVAPKGGTYWTSGVSYSPNGWLPETDFFEFECETSKQYTTSIHRIIEGEHHMVGTKKHRFPVDLSEGFHIFGMLMLPDSITFYLDNVAIWTFKMAGVNSEPVYFLIGNSIFQGCDPDLISPENKKLLFPQAAYVDYMRIYKPQTP